MDRSGFGCAAQIPTPPEPSAVRRLIGVAPADRLWGRPFVNLGFTLPPDNHVRLESDEWLGIQLSEESVTQEQVAYRLANHVIARSVGDEMLILDLDTGVYHTLNGAAGTLYRCVGDGATIETLVAALTAEFDVGAAQAREDVEAFLAAEVEAGLILLP